MQSLTKLTLMDNARLKTLPDSIGNLKNLTNLNLSNTSIEKLPDSIVNCTALKYVNILRSEIHSVPDFISSLEFFYDNKLTEHIPQGHSVSYRCFCNSYYRLAQTIIRFSCKARREGLLALEDDLEELSEDLFLRGIRLVMDGTDSDVIREVLTIECEREHDYYRKKLMEIAIEGILSIQAGDSTVILASLLAAHVDIKNNPLESACAKYLAGDINALDNIDFEAAIQPETEREEIVFIKRAIKLSEISRREGPLALDKELDQDGIAALDVFEYGLPLIIDSYPAEHVNDILSVLIERKTDPVQKNFALAKKAALLSINDGENTRILAMKLFAYLGVTVDVQKEIFDDLEKVTVITE
jgi:flagellar motor component MotA